ncbi:MAG: kelch repeat-containing protein, partial [Terriglobia bacterium]
LVHDAEQGVDVNNKITSGGINWYRLAPNADGTYKGGAFSGPFPMANARQFFASGVLTDGRVFVLGGEYSDAFLQDGCALGEIFDPRTNTWSVLTKPTPQFDFIIGDAPSCVLADGRVLFGGIFNTQTAIWDPAASLWIQAGRGFNPAGADTKTSSSSEETWTLLPDGSVLTVNVANPNNTQRYVPAQDMWVNAGQTPQNLVVQSINGVNVSEIGPALLMNDGRVIAIGGTGNTAIFDPAQPVATAWITGPAMPADPGNALAPAGLQTVIDGAACLLPGGQILCVAGRTRQEGPPISFWSNPTNFFEFDPSTFDPNNPGTIPALTNQPGNNGNDCWETSLLPLPNGQVLFASQQNPIGIYTPDATENTPNNAWRPTITTFPSTLIAGHTYILTGAQLNGLSQANSYGDDRGGATNYPLVRITDGAGNVSFLPTSQFSTMGVATGATPQTCSVLVPLGTATGSYSLEVVANGIASTAMTASVGTQDLFFIVERSTIGQGEVDGIINLLGSPAQFDDALYVVVEGFSANDLGGITAANASAPPIVPAIPNPTGNFQVQFAGPALAEDFSLPSGTVQRFTFPFRFSFPDNSVFAGAPRAVIVNASFTSGGGATVTGSAEMMLLNTPNPYILHGDQANGIPWYLSVDIRVFQMVADGSAKKFAESIPAAGNPDDLATTFISTVIGNLNTHKASLGPAFDALPQLEEPAALTLAPDNGTNKVFNFALARVRFQDLNQDINDVRLFFRTWAAQQTNAIYNSSTLYRTQTNPAGELIPVFGVQGDEIMTIPFFASKRVDATVFPMSQQTDAPNVQATIFHDSLGGRVDTYFGCWLDINQPGELIYPARLIGGSPANLPDGPYQNMGPLVSVQQLVKSAHQCLLAEISFPGLSIPTNADPSITDKLAQRNLAFVNVPNPGVPSSRVAPHPFEVKPSALLLKPDGKPDELMIEWGRIPHGTTAMIYLPQTSAGKILFWADKMYTTHRLTKVDGSTIRCQTGDVTYIPVPQGARAAFVGLMTIELPAGIHKGEEFSVTVRQITSVVIGRKPINEQKRARVIKTNAAQSFSSLPPDRRFLAWRRTDGIFRITIPVSTKQALLAGEEKYLSIMRWILKGTPVQSRWYPVLTRYIEQLGWRVDGMGGDSGLVIATGDGNWQGTKPGGGGHPKHVIEIAGKVAGLIYDGFGDFEGFELKAAGCVMHRVCSKEKRIEEIVRRAWLDRSVLVVFLAREEPCCLLSIVVGGMPPECCGD